MNLCLIDGNALAHRAFFGTSPLHRSDGFPVNAVYGYSQMLWSLLYEKPISPPPTHVVVIFDHPSKDTFRHRLWPAYKANRKAKSEDLLMQLPAIEQATTAFGLPWAKVEGVEADDVIASYVAEIKRSYHVASKVVMVTYDKDLMQLITNNCQMLKITKREWVGPQEVYARFGVRPDQIGDALALIGDDADTVPGVPTIGEKKAGQLLAVFGNLEGVICNAAKVKWPATRDALVSHGQRARVARQLITLKDDEPLPVQLDDCRFSGTLDAKPLLNFFHSMEFVSMSAAVTERLNAEA